MKKIPKWIRSILFFLFLIFLFFFRLPFYLEQPGNLFSLDEMININHQYEEMPGELYITTVGVKQLTPITMFRGFLPYRDIVSQSQLFGELDDFESYDKIQKYYMDSSINHAIKAAFDAADKKYEFEYKGVYILQILEESDFVNELKIGDLIQAVDGKEIENSENFIDYIKNKEVGEKIELQIERSSESLTVSGELIELESAASGIGIGLVDHSEIKTDPAVEIQSDNIGGPSAGLMFSLELYTQLIDENIRQDYNIAGSGTIDSDGNVGRIGGIEKKIVAANQEKMDYFLVPADRLSPKDKRINPNLHTNYQLALKTAEKINSEMTIFPVETLTDAINVLEKLKVEEKVSHEDKLVNIYQNNHRLVAKTIR